MTALMKAGADKISINTAALSNPSLITEGAKKFGNQGIVVCLDVKYNPFEKVWYAYGHGCSNDEGAQCRNALEWAKEAVDRGAGELLVTSIDRHGTGLGFDIELYQALSRGSRCSCNSLWWCRKYTAFCGFIYKNKCNWSSCWHIVT